MSDWPKIKIVMNMAGKFSFELDGRHVPGVRSFKFDSGDPRGCGSSRGPRLFLELIPGGVEFESDRTVIVLPDRDE